MQDVRPATLHYSNGGQMYALMLHAAWRSQTAGRLRFPANLKSEVSACTGDGRAFRRASAEVRLCCGGFGEKSVDFR
jgi:hypothetical protein